MKIYKIRVKTPNELGYLENLKDIACVDWVSDMNKFCGKIFFTSDIRGQGTINFRYVIDYYSFMAAWVEVLEINEE